MKNLDLTDRKKFLNQQYNLVLEERSKKEFDSADIAAEILFFPVLSPLRAINVIQFVVKEKPPDAEDLKFNLFLVLVFNFGLIIILCRSLEGLFLLLIVLFYTTSVVINSYGKQKEKERLEWIYMFLRAGIVDSLGNSVKIVNIQSDYIVFTCQGIAIKMLEDRKKNLETSLNLRIRKFLPVDNHKTFRMEFSNQMLPTKIDFDNKIVQLAKSVKDCWLIGNDGEAIYKTLDEVKHILINGATGSGKSIALRAAQTFLLISSSKNLDIFSIDFKGGLEQRSFRPWISAPAAINDKMAIQIIEFLHYQLEYRMMLFEKIGVDSIEEFRKKQPINRLMLIIDEFARLKHTLEKTKDGKEALFKIQSMAQTGRACGLTLVICSQYSDSKSLDSQTKANLPTRIVMKMFNQASSRNILESDAAFALPDIPGRHIFNAGGENHEIQGYWLSQKDSAELLEKHVDKKLVSCDFIKFLYDNKEETLVKEMQKENRKRLKNMKKLRRKHGF